VNADRSFFELLAADHSPVALLVVDGGGQRVRHVNRAMAARLGVAGEAAVGQRLAEISPSIDRGLRPLIDAVAVEKRPRRCPGLVLPALPGGGADLLWDAACAPLPTDPVRTTPALLAVWLWPEEPGTSASRQVIDALNANLRGRLPTRIFGYEVAAALVPSLPGAALGGDTYDWVDLGDDRWGILMADVSGRGPAAAARAVSVRHSARALLARHGPADALSLLSRLLLADTSFTGFVTTFLGVLDTRAGMLTYGVAGHEPALILRGDSDELETAAVSGELPLGVDAVADYTEHATPLTTRDILLLYTDGLSEARRGSEFFEVRRVGDALTRHHALPAPALVATLLAEAASWAGPDSLRDDTALLVVRGEDA
jgi:hypothetical protein